MKVSLKWLRDYVNIELAPEELAERLTMAGIEVAGIEFIGSAWDNIMVGHVTNLDTHPNADHLKLVTVDLGTQQLTVVCGAPNVSPGQKVPFAHTGAQLMDGHTGETVSLKSAKIRGVISEGMICAEKELGISDNYEGIMVLSPEAPIGVPLADYLGDVVFDLEITPNRPDCLSVIGIAREIAALTGEKLHLSEIHYEEQTESIDSFASVDIVEPDLCPRYCASLVTGITLGSSPSWLQQRLSNCGMRPISNVVDITNYVMLEYGQPLHAFDYDKLTGNVIVRRASDGETITTIDDIERILNSDILVIADEAKAVAVAGIMGGLDTEVTNKTNTILLESANFNQAAIHLGGGHLQLQSEASIRFEKGLNSGLPLQPLKRATQLLLELADGKAASGIIDVYPGKSKPKSILLSTQQVKRLLGLDVTPDEMLKVLRSLGFECRELDSPSQISVVVPYWRSDLKCSADLVEEVIRIIGYDKVPVAMLSSSLVQQESAFSLSTRQNALEWKVRNVLTGCSFQEILTYSLVSLEKLQSLSPKFEMETQPLKVANPMTKEQEYLRTSLRVGLLTTLAHNQKFEQMGIKLFEIGKIFLPQGKELPWEKEMLCAVLGGSRSALSWHGDKEMLDFFDAKGVAENLLDALGLKASFEVSSDESLFPGRAANIVVDNDELGIVGDLHPSVAQIFELSGTICLIEIDLEKLLTKLAKVGEYQAIPRFPSVSRDIALVMDTQVGYQEVERRIRGFPLVTQITLFDLYKGKQVPEGKKSFALRIVYQAPDRTLTDEEVGPIQQQILDKLSQELDATLRS